MLRSYVNKIGFYAYTIATHFHQKLITNYLVGPPNNWLSVFGGSAWQWCKHRNQFYLHNFLTSQPDLNFHNPEVQAQMLDEIKFWLDVGVDGFRFDVINFLFHDHELRNNPPKDPKLVRPY